ncbi:MAG: hypothetical protein ACR2LL_02130 [Nitrosopumilus sp.]
MTRHIGHSKIPFNNCKSRILVPLNRIFYVIFCDAPTPYQRFYEAIESPHTRPAYGKYLKDFLEYSKTDSDGIVKLKQQDNDDLVFNYLVHIKTKTDKTNVPNPNSYNVIFSSIQLFLEQNDIILNWKKIKRMYPRRKTPTNQFCYYSRFQMYSFCHLNC